MRIQMVKLQLVNGQSGINAPVGLTCDKVEPDQENCQLQTHGFQSTLVIYIRIWYSVL